MNDKFLINHLSLHESTDECFVHVCMCMCVFEQEHAHFYGRRKPQRLTLNYVKSKSNTLFQTDVNERMPEHKAIEGKKHGLLTALFRRLQILFRSRDRKCFVQK